MIIVDRLHAYNDLKDAAQMLMGRMAEIERVTVRDLYERYGVDLEE